MVYMNSKEITGNVDTLIIALSHLELQRLSKNYQSVRKNVAYNIVCSHDVVYSDSTIYES